MYNKQYTFRLNEEVDRLVQKCVDEKTLGRTNADFLRSAVCLTAVVMGITNFDDLPTDCVAGIKKVLANQQMISEGSDNKEEFAKTEKSLRWLQRQSYEIMTGINNLLYYGTNLMTDTPSLTSFKSLQKQKHEFLKAANDEYAATIKQRKMNALERNGVNSNSGSSSSGSVSSSGSLPKKNNANADAGAGSDSPNSGYDYPEDDSWEHEYDWTNEELLNGDDRYEEF